jgi:hypothetical protein
MRYFDGEVDAAEAREIEAWLDGSVEGSRALGSFERVGDALRAIADDVGTGTGTASDGIADAVMARLGEEPERAVTVSERRPVVLADRRPARAPERRFAAWMPAIGLGFAAAAAIAIYLKPPKPPVKAQGGTTVTSPAERPAPSPVASDDTLAVAAAEPEVGASIESVDFGAVAGTIFMVPGGQSSDETETPVVWLMDDAAPDEGRMAPL